jgi:branched-chain amino acid transport system ATP-binding protein
VLALENVHARYGAITALRGITLNVQEGEMVALIGVNGAGKSTVLSTIAGTLKPVQGAITFQGESLVGRPPEQIIRKGIALVPEGREIFPSLTVDENLRLGAYIRHDRAEYNHDLQEIFSLFPILGTRIHQPGGTLSGGEQQQLAIARAMMSHPRLLMLDEPSLGLAPALVDQIFELVSALHQRGVTILLVEQNVDRTLDVVDRAYLLNTGRIEMAGTPDQLRTRVDIESVYLGGQNSSPQEQS